MPGYVIKVTIEDTHPPVWRRIIVPEKISFAGLHRILQTAFQWEDEHMHEFSFPGAEARVVMKEDSFGEGVEEGHALVDNFLRSCKFIRYTYDFGDDWRHKIVFEKDAPDYNFRYATVIKYKGDSFEEDSGGIWGNADEDGRVPFDLEQINQKLKAVKLSVQKERKESRELLDEILMEKKLKEFSRTGWKKMQKAIQDIMKEEPVSEVEKRTRRWEFLCETEQIPREMHIIKNVSKKSSVDLFCQNSMKSVREHCKYIGVRADESASVMQCAVKFWDEFARHPEYLAYIFDWEELQELMELIQAPNGECSRVPDQITVQKALALTLFDFSEEAVNRNSYAVLRQTPEAAELIGRYTPKEWQRISRERMKRGGNVNYLLNMYNMMKRDSFCEKYQEYFEASVSKDEVLRAVYLGGTFCRELQTAETVDGIAYIAQNFVDMEKVLLSQQGEGVEIEYRTFSSKDRKKFSQGYSGMYPVWAEYFDYMIENYEIDEWETEEYLLEDYNRVKNGEGAEVLWKDVLEGGMAETVDSYVSFWSYFLGVCLTTGIPKYMGYSREEYADIKGISPAELGLYGDFEPVHKITKKTHLYEMPLELQLRIYKIVSGPVNRKAQEALEELIQETGIENYELEYLTCGGYLKEEEYDKAEKCLKRIQKAYPKDENIKHLLDTIKSLTWPEEEEISVWDMIDGKTPKSNVVTFRREQPKIGRNDPCPCGSGKKYKKCCGKK